jgi:hypothetical protein
MSSNYYNPYQNASNHAIDAQRYIQQYNQMRQRQWWEEPQTLHIHGLEAATNLHYDSVSFIKRICDPFGKLHSVMVNIDCMELKYMMPEDVCRRLERGASESPEWMHCGPTNKDLENPSIANAWSEWKMIYILAKGK